MLSSAFPLFHSPLLLAALLLYQCVIVQLLGLCPLTGNTHKPSQLMLTAAALAVSVFLRNSDLFTAAISARIFLGICRSNLRGA